MSTPNNLGSLLKGLSSCTSNKETSNKNKVSKASEFSIEPAQLLVIAGLLTNVLEVESVLVDRDQAIEIVISGSLKRKTDLDKMLDEIGSMSFDEVVSAIISRAE